MLAQALRREALPSLVDTAASSSIPDPPPGKWGWAGNRVLDVSGSEKRVPRQAAAPYRRAGEQRGRRRWQRLAAPSCSSA